MTVPYVHSKYKRIEDDNYQTVDKRCVKGLVETTFIHGKVIDVCSPNGSEIVNALRELGHEAYGYDDAFIGLVLGSWIITNPPYKKGIVDEIVWRQIQRVEKGEVVGFAVLLRTNFDHAKTRKGMFSHPLYFGQVKLCFRPYWTEERKHSPIHNYVWHIWRGDTNIDYPIMPYVRYWYPE